MWEKGGAVSGWILQMDGVPNWQFSEEGRPGELKLARTPCSFHPAKLRVWSAPSPEQVVGNLEVGRKGCSNAEDCCRII